MPKNFRIPLLVLLCLFLNVARAAAFDWDPVSDQEKQLKDNPLDPGSGALVIFKRGEIDVQQPTASLWTTKILTYTRIKIINDAGRDAANVVLETPKFMRMTRIEGRTVLPSGEIIPLDTSKVFRGVSYQDGDFAEVTTSFAFSSVQPGAIIEYQTEENVDWFYSPAWIFDTRGLGTLQSSLRTVINTNMSMEQMPVGITAKRLAVTQKQTAVGLQTDFAVQFLDPIRNEPYSTPFRDRALMLLLTPSHVRFAGQAIPLITSWNDVGKEFGDRITNMNKTKNETDNKARDLAEKISDPRGRAEAIYRYLQENITSSNLAGVEISNRSADDVITSKRSDPDDINAVFATMLKDVKVDADLVLVATSNWDTLTEAFPNLNQFSRMIVRVNLKDGAVYADAAAPGAPFGELPWFERGITGMLMKGGKVLEVQIPMGAPEENLSAWKYDMKLSPDWKVEGDEEMDLKGVRAIDYRGNAIEESPDKVSDTLNGTFALGHEDSVVSNVVHPDFQDTTQSLAVKAHVQYSITDQTGPGEMLMNPWMRDVYTSSPFKSTERQSYIHFEIPEKHVTTSSWTLSPNIQVEKLPAAVNMQGDVADFSHSCAQNGNTVTCTRTLTIKKTMMMGDPSTYSNVKRFFDEITQHDQEVILLQKK